MGEEQSANRLGTRALSGCWEVSWKCRIVEGVSIMLKRTGPLHAATRQRSVITGVTVMAL